jgi:hypothetical protein
MSRKAESTVNRVVRHLAAAGGSGILGDVSRRLGLCGALNRALRTDPALAQFVAQESCRNKVSHRTQARLTLTALGAAYAQTLKPGWKPARLSLVDWQAQLDEMTQERVPAALRIQRDRADAQAWTNHERERKARERAAEYERSKQKLEPKRPSAGRVRSDEENEARAEWARSQGFKPAYDDSNEKPDYDGRAAARKSAEAHTSKPAFTPRPSLPIAQHPEPTSAWERNLQQGREHDAERRRIMQQAGSPQPALEQLEARKLEAERRQRDCVICQAGVDPSFSDHDPVTHLAYLGK